MATHIYRAVVRGMFDDLDEPMRARLLADVEAHDIFVSAFTAAGTFTYDRALVAFNFRYEVRQVTEDGESSPAEVLGSVEERAMELALASLGDDGLRAKHLRVQAWDMADSWRPSGSR